MLDESALVCKPVDVSDSLQCAHFNVRKKCRLSLYFLYFAKFALQTSRGRVHLTLCCCQSAC